MVRATGRPGRIVPSDAFQGRSPEIAACDALKRLFTAVAARAVLAEELERAEREDTVPSETYETLKAYMDENPIRTERWMRELMSRDDITSRALGLRLLEVRKTYADEVFNFDEMRETVMSEVSSENDRLMADYVRRMLPAATVQKTEGVERAFRFYLFVTKAQMMNDNTMFNSNTSNLGNSARRNNTEPCRPRFQIYNIRQLLASLDVRSGEENNVIFVVHLDNFGVHVGVATVVCKSSVVSLKRAVDDGVVVLF